MDDGDVWVLQNVCSLAYLYMRQAFGKIDGGMGRFVFAGL